MYGCNIPPTRCRLLLVPSLLIPFSPSPMVIDGYGWEMGRGRRRMASICWFYTPSGVGSTGAFQAFYGYAGRYLLVLISIALAGVRPATVSFHLTNV